MGTVKGGRRAGQIWKVTPVIRAFALFSILAASAGAVAAAAQPPASDALSASAPWWEKLIVTTGDAGASMCRYQSSHNPGEEQACEVEGDGAATGPMVDEATRVTFERRFSPTASADLGSIDAGDTLLGKSVIALAIDAKGAVKGCKLLSSSGTMTPDYGCAEARTEKFTTSAASDSGPYKVATMTILVYARQEHFA